MKQNLYLLISIIICIGCKVKEMDEATDPSKTSQIVDTACGQCQFDMDGKFGCDLAVKIDSAYYFVAGTGINEHGDAHADDGFCETIRKAEVTGEVTNGIFQVESFKLITQNSTE